MKNQVLVATLSATLLAPQSVDAKSNYSFKEVLDAKPADEAFIYKVHACFKFDSAMLKLSKSKDNSTIFTDKGMDNVIDAYIAIYGHTEDSFRGYENHQTTTMFVEKMIEGKGPKHIKESMLNTFEKCKETYYAILRHHGDAKKLSAQSSGEGTKGTNERHKDCLEAKDYQGCMKYQASSTTISESKDDCSGKICLILTKGADVFGLPKPVGWRSYQADDGRLFYFSRTYRIPHQGQQTRYVGFKRITRYYESPKSGSSGTFIGGASSSTNCSGYGASISCTTSSDSPVYIPGTSARPGGVSSTYFEAVYDCKDDTTAAYKKGKLWIGWKKGEADKHFFADLLKNTCQKGEEHIQKLPILDLKM